MSDFSDELENQKLTISIMTKTLAAQYREILHLKKQNTELLSLLAKLEWCIKSYPDMPTCCPRCMNFKTSGHKADCELGNLLKKEREGAQLWSSE